ncbi:hypothetical protein G5S35_17580 [Paraburkholderia tropica]|uniref:hypothetical protein n=1 Tax=Paraburkholderia tropica TaxID=92647 RepID=UPI0016029021|nr:hypothetical protein [Paraburkholderia tropica]QNB13441.1 hypothetical protein G5S35_17580 [Paraburkholderia tropica]
MALKKTLAGVAPFASLLSKARGAKAEENERDQREGESDDEYAKRMEELDEKEKAEQEERDKEAARARGEGNDVDGDDADAEDDGDDETDDAKKAARAAERTRCARIIAHGIALGQPEQAATLAFDSKVSSAVAAQVLQAGKMAVAPAAAPRASRPTLDERMAHARPMNPGNGAPAAAAPTMAEQILMAGKIRRGEA